MLATISDQKTPDNTTIGDAVTYYKPVIITANDYYPFGMLMPGRDFSLGSNKYRYGFNGQERSTEINEDGNSMTAEFWQYDARLGRRWNLDPVYKHSPYECFGGNPIFAKDYNGKDTMPGNYSLGMKSQIPSLEKGLQLSSGLHSEVLKGSPESSIGVGWFIFPYLKIRNRTYAPNAIFKFTAGYSILTQHVIGGEMKSIDKNSDLHQYLSYMKLSPSGVEWNEYTNPDVGLFVFDGTKGSDDAWINAIVGSFVQGNGPENWIFGENSGVTNKVVNSLLGLDNTFKNYYNAGSPENYHEKYPYDKWAQLLDLARYGTPLSLSNMIGSYDVFIRKPDNESLIANVTIINVMSMTSGDIGKHLPGNNWSKSWIRGSGTGNTGPVMYSNTSQVFMFTIPAYDPSRFIKGLGLMY